MVDKSLFNRTVKTNVVLYKADGMGRDGFITYNDAGFWKEHIKEVKPEIKYGRKPFPCFKSLKNIPPSWKYHSDGTGRDTYILSNFGGLIKKYNSPGGVANLIRGKNEESNEYQRDSPPKFSLSKAEKMYQKNLKELENGIVDRLYNRCIGKFRKKNLIKSNSSIDINSNRRMAFFGNTTFGNRNAERVRLGDILPNRTIKYGMNYRTEDDNYFTLDYRSGSLPKFNNSINNINKRYNGKKIQVVSNSLNKSFGYPMIGTPKNLAEEEKN